MKILSLEKISDVQMEVWLEDAGKYRHFAISSDNSIVDYDSIDKKRYQSYDHFVAVMGKFNPYVIFRVKPVVVKTLDFEELTDLRHQFEKEAREYQKQLDQQRAAEGGSQDVG